MRACVCVCACARTRMSEFLCVLAAKRLISTSKLVDMQTFLMWLLRGGEREHCG